MCEKREIYFKPLIQRLRLIFCFNFALDYMKGIDDKLSPFYNLQFHCTVPFDLMT